MKNFLAVAGKPTGIAALDELLLVPVATDTNPNCPGFDTLLSVLSALDSLEQFCTRLGDQVFRAAMASFAKDCSVHDITPSPFRFRVWIAAHGTTALRFNQDVLVRRMMQDYQLESEQAPLKDKDVEALLKVYEQVCELTQPEPSKPACPVGPAPVESGHASDLSGPA